MARLGAGWRVRAFALLSVSVLASPPADAAGEAGRIEVSEQATYSIVERASGLDHPWSMAFLPDGRIIVTERVGALRIVSVDGAVSPPLGGLPEIAVRGQGGLLDVALHPDFARNRLIYLTFVEGDRRVGTAVASARLGDAGLSDWRVLFAMEPKVDSDRHFGSRLAFAPDGTFYASFGDRGQRDEAQDPGNHIGTVIRLNDDGTVPMDNPFVGTASGRPEVISYGHRNVQGLALNPWSGEIWAHEHGPRGGDEVNIIRPGVNYGWPAITYGKEYSGGDVSPDTALPGMAQPVVYWVPSIAPSGMAFYDGGRFADWRGDLFVGALAGQHLRRLELDGDAVVGQEELLVGLEERIRDVRSGPDGYLYVLTDGANARLLRLEPI